MAEWGVFQDLIRSVRNLGERVISVAWHLREYVETFAAQGGVILSQLVVFKLTAHWFGPEGFSEFAISRRVVSAIQPLTWMGLGVALPRYLAFSTIGENVRGRYYAATIVVIAVVTGACAAALNIWAGRAALLFFGSADYTYLILPISILLAGMGLHAIVYSYFRGRQAWRAANTLYIVNLGVAPLAAILVFRESAALALFALGGIWVAVASIAFVITPWHVLRSFTWESTVRMLRYGVPRVPGQFLAMGLLAAPAMVAAHTDGVRAAGYVAFGTSVVSLMGAGFTPISFVLLPKASYMIGEGAMDQLKGHVRKLLTVTVAVCVAVTVVVVALGGPLVHLYLGPAFSGAAPVVRLAAWAVTPYCAYVVLRGVIDAFHERALNTRNVAIACAAFGVTVALLTATGAGVGGTMISLTVAAGVLGALSWWEVRRIFSLQMGEGGDSGAEVSV